MDPKGGNPIEKHELFDKKFCLSMSIIISILSDELGFRNLTKNPT